MSRPRIAIACPPTPECQCIEDWLASAGFEPFRVSSHPRAGDGLQDRALDLLVVDATSAGPAINAARARRPLLPIIVLGEANPVAESQALARGAVYLTRPVDRDLFVCTVSMAVMENRPVRRSERKLAQFGVVVQGVASQVIDVSREGLRIEIPRARKVAPPPPVFDVSVPMLGVSLNVRRLWAAAPPRSAREAIWYGGELSNNPRRVELAWLRLVDALPGAHVSLEVQ